MLKPRHSILLIAAIILSVIIAIFVSTHNKNDLRNLRFAEASSVWWNAPMLLADSWGLYKKNGLNIQRFDVVTGLASQNAVMNGNAEFGVVATTPLVLAASKNEDILILGSYMKSDDLMSVVTRSSGESKWWNGPIGYVPGTVSEFFLISALILEGKQDLYYNKQLNLVSLQPPGIPQAFANRDILSGVIFEPFASFIVRAPGKQAEIGITKLDYSGTYTLKSYIITSKKVWEEQKEDVIKFVRSFKQACDEIVLKPDVARIEMERKFGYSEREPGWLKENWKKVDFQFSLDADEINKTLLREADLMHAAGIISSTPNFDSLLFPLKKNLIRDLK